MPCKLQLARQACAAVLANTRLPQDCLVWQAEHHNRYDTDVVMYMLWI